MAFYANKVDLSHYGRYQFDKIFSSRAAMDKEASLGTDGLFAGRFALVSYSPDPDTEFKAIDIILGYRDTSTGIIYADIRKTQPYIYTEFTHLEAGSPELRASNYNKLYYYDGTNYIRLASSSQFIEGNTNYYIANVTDTVNIVSLNSLVRIVDIEGTPTGVYYKCVGDTQGEPAIWSEILLGSYEDASYSYPDYLVNFNLDRATYGESFDTRGYDGTVWQKVFSDGYGKFIFIGRTSAVMPAIELYPDPPSELPKAPYIDALSSDSFYRIHVPSMFGFQIKHADQNELSDQTGTVTRYHINDDTGAVTETIETIPLGIYFNKDGMDATTRIVDSTTTNEIQITPTGESGKTYYDEQGNLVTTDMLELTIHAPVLGNLIATGYDMLYGPNSGSGETIYRPRDIEWIDGTKSNTIKLQGEDLTLHGKTHELKTIAGILNTMHDRLGQIIVHVPNGESLPLAGSMSPDLIYEQNDRFYRRSEGGVIEPVDLLEYDYTEVNKSTLQNLNPFPTNKYFSYPEGGMTHLNNQTQLNNLHEINNYNSSADVHYYLRNLNNTRFHKVNPKLIQYEQNTYYRLIGSEYIIDSSQSFPIDNTVFYWKLEKEPDQKTFLNEYKSDGTFFTRAQIETMDSGYYEYTPYTASIPDRNNVYFKPSITTIYSNKVYYIPNVFYTYNTTTKKYTPATTPTMQAHTTYYALTFLPEVHYGLNSDNEVVEYRVMDQAIEMTNLENKPTGVSLYYLTVDGHYLPYEYLSQIDLINNRSPYTIPRTYYRLNFQGPYTVNNLFLTNTFYSVTDTGYKLASEWSGDVNTPYYDIIKGYHMVQNTQYFYMPDTYYYKTDETDEFALAWEDEMVHADYYTQTAVYVDVDTLGQCPHGLEWNPESPYIPPSISLYRKTDIPAIEEMVGVANGESTIHGILLQLHKQFDFDNLETRNPSTFRGCLNELKDMLYRIKEARPGHILMVNDFGQIVSMDIPEGSVLVGGSRGKVTTMTLQQLKQALNAI